MHASATTSLWRIRWAWLSAAQLLNDVYLKRIRNTENSSSKIWYSKRVRFHAVDKEQWMGKLLPFTLFQTASTRKTNDAIAVSTSSLIIRRVLLIQNLLRSQNLISRRQQRQCRRSVFYSIQSLVYASFSTPADERTTKSHRRNVWRRFRQLTSGRQSAASRMAVGPVVFLGLRRNEGGVSGARRAGRDLVGALASVTTVVRDVQHVICSRLVASATSDVVVEDEIWLGGIELVSVACLQIRPVAHSLRCSCFACLNRLQTALATHLLRVMHTRFLQGAWSKQ